MAAREAAKVKFTKREKTGKGTCRKLRVQGTVPAVFYGPEYKESMVGTVGIKEISPVANSANWETNIMDVEMPDGKVEMALLRGVQRHAITQNILHVDLYQLVRGHKVKVAIPVRYVNKEICAGVKMGGVLEHPIREVEIMVLPREIPSEIVLDVAPMKMGEEIFVNQLELPESAEVLTPGDAVVLHIVRPRSMGALSLESEIEETAEVEVIGKGKKEGE